jgi:hypothetical protein
MTDLRAIARRAYRDLVRSERTALRWSNPLSIYSPDPTAVAVAMFNLSRQERMVALRQGLDDLRNHLAAVQKAELVSQPFRGLGGARNG